MKYFGASLVLACLSMTPFAVWGQKQSLRTELASQERSRGYSLIDSWGSLEVYVNLPESRTSVKAAAKNIQELTSNECASPDSRFSVFRKNGIWLRDRQSGDAEEIEREGDFSAQCFSPDQKFVYFANGMIRIHDVRLKKSSDLWGQVKQTWPTWSPDGKWIGFDYGKHYVLLNAQNGARKKLFRAKDSSGVAWSPDSRYLTYTKPGGSTGGFLFWGIKCIEPYRVWVWRVEDSAHDWVQEICKPGRSLQWVDNSSLSVQ